MLKPTLLRKSNLDTARHRHRRSPRNTADALPVVSTKAITLSSAIDLTQRSLNFNRLHMRTYNPALLMVNLQPFTLLAAWPRSTAEHPQTKTAALKFQD